jgi:sulfatase modifying factor 1
MQRHLQFIGAAVSIVVMIFSGCNFSAAGNETKIFEGIEMVKIPAGEVPGFWIGKYEVTQKQYEDIMGNNPSFFQGNPNNPVEHLSWYSAVEFCNKLSIKAGFKPYYTINKNKKDPENKNKFDNIKWTVTINKGSNGFRFLTSREHEYAYRAGTTTTYYWGNEINDDYCWYRDSSGSITHPVGQKKPNAWGLFDISGNVFEWCFDWFDDSGYNRVTRGGSWLSHPAYVMAVYIYDFPPNYAIYSIGLRLARNE